MKQGPILICVSILTGLLEISIFTSIQQESNLRLLFFRKLHEDHMWRRMFRNETFFRSLFWPLQRYMITRLSNEEIWKSLDINYLPMIKISIFIWILQSWKKTTYIHAFFCNCAVRWLIIFQILGRLVYCCWFSLIKNCEIFSILTASFALAVLEIDWFVPEVKNKAKSGAVFISFTFSQNQQK